MPVDISVTTVKRSGRKLAVSILRNATARVQPEEKLRWAENFYEQVLEKALKDLVVFNLDGEFEYVNPQGVDDPRRCGSGSLATPTSNIAGSRTFPRRWLGAGIRRLRRPLEKRERSDSRKR